MANAIVKQTIEDGDRNVVVKATIVGDGVEGDYTNELLIDASAYSGAPTNLKIMRIQASLNGFTMTLEWNATSNVDIISIPTDEAFDMDFSHIGGLPNTKATGFNGDIDISTTGLGAEDGTITLFMKKKDI